MPQYSLATNAGRPVASGSNAAGERSQEIRSDAAGTSTSRADVAEPVEEYFRPPPTSFKQSSRWLTSSNDGSQPPDTRNGLRLPDPVANGGDEEKGDGQHSRD